MKTKLQLALLGTMMVLALPISAQAQRWGGDQDGDASWQDQQDQYRPDQYRPVQYRPDQPQQDQYRPDQDRRDPDRRDQPPYPQNGFWAHHPGYLQALSDLRTALALVQHQDPSGPGQASEEYQAANEITAAYNELQQAAVSDGRNINDQPPPDFQWGNHQSRLQQANELLVRASHEIRGEEENPAADGLRDRAIRHIGGASHWIQLAERAWRY